MNIYGISREKLENYFLSINEKKFKAIQVYEWIYDKRVTSFFDMTNLKKDFSGIIRIFLKFSAEYLLYLQSKFNKKNCKLL